MGKQQFPPKYWHLPTRSCGMASQKTVIVIGYLLWDTYREYRNIKGNRYEIFEMHHRDHFIRS
jgi:hypothetical protein